MDLNSNNQPLVSIITITLNRANLIGRAIESIQKQTYQNYEHIIVDGNSSDNTQEVVLSYNDPKIKYIKLSDKGPGRQSKAGLDIAKGKYLAMLDDDDEYIPTKIEKQVTLFETLSDEYGIVYCWMSYFDNHTKKLVRMHATKLRGFVGDAVVEKPLVSGTPTLMLRKKYVDDLGRVFDDNIGVLMSDWEFVAKICQKCKVDYVAESLVNVFINHGQEQLSNAVQKGKSEKQITFHNYFLNEFSEVFERNPKLKSYHLAILCRSYFKLHRWKEGFAIYLKLLKCNFSIRYFLIPLSSLIKK